MFGINKLHKYAGPSNWLLVDKNGDFQEVRRETYETLYDAIRPEVGFACRVEMVKRPFVTQVMFHDFQADDSWPIAAIRPGVQGWESKLVGDLPEECRLSDAARSELVDKLGWFQQVSFFFL